MYPMQNANTSGGFCMPTTSSDGHPLIYMMPVCFCDPSKMPKEMKMPNMPYPIFPYPMTFQQNPPEAK